MKLKWLKMGMAAGILMGTVSAQAITYWDLDLFSPRGGGWLNEGASLTGVFDISNDDVDGVPDNVGFDPVTEDVVGASVHIYLYNDPFHDWLLEDPWGTVEVNLDTTVVGTKQIEWWGDLLGYQVGGNLLYELNINGTLGYEIEAIEGDFGVGKTKLIAHARPSMSVADAGSIFTLLGAALIGLEGLRRRLT